MREFTGAIAALLSAIIGLAIVAVLVSRNSQTGSVLTSFGTAFGSIIQAAVGPVNSAGSVTQNASLSAVPSLQNFFSSPGY